MSSYEHPDKNKRDALILGKDPTDVLDDITLTAEPGYSINFNEQQKKILLKIIL